MSEFAIFLEKLKHHENWGYGYPEFAGGEVISLFTDSDIDPDYSICPEGGDLVIFNKREQGGLLGIDDAAGEIWDVELLETSDYFGLYENEVQRPLHVPTDFLWERYLYIGNLFSTFDDHIDMDFGFESYEELNEEFDDELPHLKNDTHLCLYWLLIFGFLDNQQQFQVVLGHSPKEQELIQQCLAFFQELPNKKDIDLSYPSHTHTQTEQEFYKTAFRKRQASLMKLYNKEV